MADIKYSILNFEGDGSTLNWPISFAGGYISKSHVKAFILASDDVATDLELEWVGDFTVKINPPVPAGKKLVIYRNTPKNLPLVDFNDDSILGERDLNLNARQAVFIAAEMVDKWGPVDGLSGLVSSINSRISTEVSIREDETSSLAERLDTVETDMIVTEDLGLYLLTSELGSKVSDLTFTYVGPGPTTKAGKIVELISTLDQSIVDKTTGVITNTNLQAKVNDVTTTYTGPGGAQAIKFSDLFATVVTISEGKASAAASAAVTDYNAAIVNGTNALGIKISNIESSTNAKPGVYRQPTAPPTIGRITGDQWFDTDDGNHPYVWASGAWQDNTDGRFNDLIDSPGTWRASVNSSITTLTTSTTASAEKIDKMGALNGDKSAFILDTSKVYVDATTSLAVRFTNITSSFSALPRIFRQTTAPTGPHNVGDQWFDTDDGNKHYVWTGAAFADNSDGRFNELTTNPGTFRSTVESAITSLTTSNSALASKIDKLGVTNGANTAFILNTSTVKLDTDVTTLGEVITRLSAHYSVTLDVDGYVSGVYANNDGSTSDWKFKTATFKIEGVGGTPFTPFAVDTVNNRVTMTNVYIDKLVAGSVNAGAFQANATMKPTLVTWVTPINADGTYKLITTETVVAEEDGLLEVFFDSHVVRSGPDGPWEVVVKIDGDYIRHEYGTSQGGVALHGTAEIGAGSHNVTLEFQGQDVIPGPPGYGPHQMHHAQLFIKVYNKVEL